MSDPAVTADQLTQLQTLQRVVAAKKQFGLLFYSPHPKQDLFHRAGGKKFRYVRTGNRFGKSALGAAEDSAWLLGYRPWYAEGDPARYEGIPKRSVKGLIIVADWDKANEIFTNPVPGIGLGKLFRFLPKDKIRPGPRNNAGVISSIHVQSMWGGESTIYLDTVKSFMANPMGQESSDWDFIHIDEPCPKDMWVANSRGLIDRGGKAWFTCTPIAEAWINDKFVPRGVYRKEVTSALEMDDEHWMITGSTYDNPYNDQKAIESFEKDLTESEKQARINGIPLALSGLVYKEFKQDIHVWQGKYAGWENVTRPPADYTIRVAIDTHPQKPHAVLFVATGPDGVSYFFHEIFRKCLISDLAEGINEILKGYEPQSIIIDPSAFIESPIDGTCFADVLADSGIFAEKASKDLARGILQTQQALSETTRTPGGVIVPKLLFSPHMSETLWEFDHYTWDTKKGREGKPIDRDDHMMENLYRLVVDGLTYVKPQLNTSYEYMATGVKYLNTFKV